MILGALLVLSAFPRVEIEGVHSTRYARQTSSLKVESFLLGGNSKSQSSGE